MARQIVAGIVGQDQRTHLVSRNPGQRPRRCCTEQIVGLVRHNGTSHLEHPVGEVGVRHRCARRVAVQLAFQLEVDQGDHGRSAGRCGRPQQHARSCAAEVLVRCVDHHVGLGRIMDGGHLAVADADRLMQHLHHRRQAGGGAGGRGQKPMFPRNLASSSTRTTMFPALASFTGATTLTRFAPRPKWPSSRSVFRNLPVHSSTMPQPRSPRAAASGAAPR